MKGDKMAGADGDARRRARARLAALSAPIAARLADALRELLPEVCAGGCTPCHTLLRRYRHDERTAHPPHYDRNSLVTTVVSLSDPGDYTGGLYLGAGESRRLVRLGAGDAVVHQAGVLHGVDVPTGERWSMIFWWQDAAGCDADVSRWDRAGAELGNPVSMWLHGSRSGDWAWVRRAAEAGVAAAQADMGLESEAAGAYEDAERWLAMAADTDHRARYHLGLLASRRGRAAEAIHHHHQAVVRWGSRAAACALGDFAARSDPPDARSAAAWFERCGGAEGYSRRADVSATAAERTQWGRRAAAAGHVQWSERLAGAGEAEPPAAVWARAAAAAAAAQRQSRPAR
eukprot:TRINITY_DN7255_c0_g1_i1.p2 TRINITY_DN7255_c0_g1~~TRINITY_DN7255_c0_g1_i1.p2  ORF type:complete len:345 (+),score=81.71 TRINITY_DN7255_c0_g1_i1:469-1503(+)